MKTKNIAVVMSVTVAVALLMSCSKEFLNRPPQSSFVDASFYQTDAQVLQGTAALYSMAWKDYCDKANWKMGDAKAGVVGSPGNNYDDYGDFTKFQITGTSNGNKAAYIAFYEVIGQANTVRDNINAYAGSGVTPAIKNHAIAECRFMRATALAYLVMNYGPVPIVDDNEQHLVNSVLKRNTVSSIWKFIIKDYQFAAQNLLPTLAGGQAGRLTKWSAEAMLARTYLNVAGLNWADAPNTPGTLDAKYLDSAKYYADRVITLSGKGLLTNYADLFKYPYDNNNESLFELEWVYTSGSNSYQYANTMDSQISPDASLGEGWGSAWGASLWALSLYDGLFNKYTIDVATHSETARCDSSLLPGFTKDQRLQATFMLPGFKYPELVQNGTTTTFIDANNVIQYNPSNVQRNGDIPAHSNGHNLAYIKKYVIGTVKPSAQQDYPNNVYMLRLAEMFLIYAEAAVLDNTAASDAKALSYFNAVHTRAGLPAAPVDSLTSSHAWDYIFHERVKEFAFEGMVWYDLVRLHYYDTQNHVYHILQSQDRGEYLVVPTPWPNPTGWSFFKTAWFTLPDQIDKATVSDANFYCPIPADEIAQAPSLSAPPVDYGSN